MRCYIRGALLGTFFFLCTSFSHFTLFADDQNLITNVFLEEGKALSVKIPIGPVSCADSFLQFNDNFEGYPEGTLIKTVSGYVPIESLRIDDILDGIDGGQEIVSIKKVKKDGIYCYGLTTEHHGFYIYPDEFVHNMDFAYITAAGSLGLGIIEVFNPVIILVGALIPLTVYAVDCYVNKQAGQKYNLQEALQDIDVVQQTRNYYEIKRKDLSNLYQELLQLKNNLNFFVRSSYKNTATFSSNLLSSFQYQPYQFSLLSNVSVEQRYSALEKEKLLLLREQELQKLEGELFDIEVILGLHINELIDRCRVVYRDLKEHMSFVNEHVSLWNQYKNNLWYDLVIRSYEASFIQEALSHDLEKKIQELRVVITFYNKINHRILGQTSNIYQILQQQIAINDVYLQDLAEWNKNLYQWRQLDANYLQEAGALSYQLIENFKSNAEKIVADKEKVAVIQAKKKKDSMKEIQQMLLKEGCVAVGAGGPDPDDEEKKFFLNLIKNSVREAVVKQFGKFYKDPKTGLWWSKDRAFHGGPHYKVFKEVSTGFNWVFNADMLGNKIIGQHKGPVGRFIPYKYIRFLR